VSIRSQEQVALLTDYDADSAFCSAYQTLYANLRFNWSNELRQQRTLLITSPVAHVAQSTVAANVAIAAAQSGTPTILVDADLRAPGLAQRFGIGEHVGLRELLLLKEPLTFQQLEGYLSDTFIADLRLLSAGTAAASAGTTPLLSAQLSQVIDCLRQYLNTTKDGPGFIVFKTSAVLVGPDASLLGAQVEQTILTIAKDRTTRAQAKQAQE